MRAPPLRAAEMIGRGNDCSEFTQLRHNSAQQPPFLSIFPLQDLMWCSNIHSHRQRGYGRRRPAMVLSLSFCCLSPLLIVFYYNKFAVKSPIHSPPPSSRVRATAPTITHDHDTWQRVTTMTTTISRPVVQSRGRDGAYDHITTTRTTIDRQVVQSRGCHSAHDDNTTKAQSLPRACTENSK